MLAHLRFDILREPRARVDHRQQDAADAERRVEPPADQVDRLHQLAQPFERVVLRLHRHEHAIGGRERVHRQRPERGRAVEEDEVVLRRAGRERLRQVALAVGSLRELDDGAGEIGLGRHDVEVRERGVLRELGERRAVEQVVARGAVRAHAETGGRIRLRIEVDHERALAGLREAGGEVDGSRRLADAALLIRERVDPGHGSILATGPDGCGHVLCQAPSRNVTLLICEVGLTALRRPGRASVALSSRCLAPAVAG